MAASAALWTARLCSTRATLAWSDTADAPAAAQRAISLAPCLGAGQLPPALSQRFTPRAGPSHAGLGASVPGAVRPVTSGARENAIR